MKNLKRLIREEIDDSMDWIKQHAFHLDLMSQNKRKIESLSEVKKILFNPAVMTSNQKFKDVAYYLEDRNYMPKNLVFDQYLSYIEITEHIEIPRRLKRTTHDMHLIRSGMYNGKYFVGPSVSDDELIEMSKEDGSFWYEEFIGTFLPHKLNR